MAEHERCYKEKDWGRIQTKVLGLCTSQVSQHNEIRELEDNVATWLKDIRTSNKADFEKAEKSARETFVAKIEFNLIKPGDFVTQREIADIKKIFYGFALAVISYMMRGLFI